MNIKELSKEVINKEIENKLRLKVQDLTNELKDKTPVDTGMARDSWGFKKVDNKYVISNNVEYIDELNAGTSKQAPAFFVEETAMSYGKPVGTIVSVK